MVNLNILLYNTFVRTKKSTFKLGLLDYRLFLTMDELEKINKFSNAKGFYDIFIGSVCADEYSNLSTFHTLKNMTSKKISMRLINLLRHKYVSLIYCEKNEQLYYRLTNLGKVALSEYNGKKKKLLKKFVEQKEENIVEIINHR